MVTVAAPTELIPQRLKMSYAEYLKFASDSNIMEWVEGEVIIYMPPLDRHQELVLFLSKLLHSFIQFFNLGTLRFAPFEVRLWPDGPSREPDIIFISHKNLSQLTSRKFEGGPDLVIEIISPGSVTEDRVHKFTEYERAGVREYWLIDPRPHQEQVEFFILREDNVYRPALLNNDGIYHATVLPNFWLNPTWLWQKKLPNSELILAEIMLSVENLPAEAKDAYQAMYNLWAGRD
ncbi:MAG: Uma2 family endonuclease [Anaerolineae bacterium]|nr:Uma2 family endonuclease [Anaerolineae bacterium]